MKCAIFIYCVTPHLLPLAEELIRLCGKSNCELIYLNEIGSRRSSIGWDENCRSQFRRFADNPDACRKVLETVENLLVEVRDPELFEIRRRKGLRTFYTSERWFKPRIGLLKLLVPSFRRMAWRIARLLNEDRNFIYLPVGLHAAEDMHRLCEIVCGRWQFWFKCDQITFERRPGGLLNVTDKQRMWAYYVAPSLHSGTRKCDEGKVRILWVGRMLRLKRVEDIIRAIHKLNAKSSSCQYELDLYGLGIDKVRLQHIAANDSAVRFHPPVPVAKVRELMRCHDVYVFSSDYHEGWGAVVGEAIEEGMSVIGTYEAGASVTLLPETCLYHSGDVKRLVELLSMRIPRTEIGDWTPAYAARWLLSQMS